MVSRLPQCHQESHRQDAIDEVNHTTPEHAVVSPGGSKPSSHRHRTAIEHYGAVPCLSPLNNALTVHSAVNNEAAADVIHGVQMTLEEAATCASTAPIHTAPGSAHVAKSEPLVVNIHLEHEDTTASHAASTPVSATHRWGKRGRKRAYSARATGGSDATSDHVVGPPHSQPYLRGKAVSAKGNVGSRLAIAAPRKAAVSVPASGDKAPPLRDTMMSAEGRIPALASPRAFFTRDALGDSEPGLNSNVSTDAAAATPRMPGLNAPGSSRRILQTNAMKPSVLTHIVGEYIIQVALEPFPVDYESPVVGLVSRVLLMDTDGEVGGYRITDTTFMNGRTPVRQELPEYESPPLSPARTTRMRTEAEPSTPGQETSANKNPRRWTVQEVTNCILDVPGCAASAKKFSWHEIDGEALFLLTIDHIITTMDIKLGPAVKIWDKINTLREKH